MRKLLLVLLLVVYPAYGQDYTVTPVEVKPPLQNLYETGGTNLNLADDGVAYNINIGFDFEFYGNIFNTVNISNNGFITFTGLDSMCCNGMTLPAWGMDNSIMPLWTDLISINGANPYYKSYAVQGDRVFTVGWYNTLEFYNPDWTNTFEITLYKDSNNILFNYENLNVYQHSLTAGIQGSGGEYQQIYHGSSTESLANTAYLFTYTAPSPPEPETPIAPDCTINPGYVNCIINADTPTPIYLVDSNNNNALSSVDTLVEPNQVLVGTFDLESFLANNEMTELSDEQTEKELKDDITDEILEQVLAIEITETERRDRNTNNEDTTEIIQLATVSHTLDEMMVIYSDVAAEIIQEEATMTEFSEDTLANNETMTNVETLNEITVNDDTDMLVENNTDNTGMEETIEQLDTVELPVLVQNQNESDIENISIENVIEDTNLDDLFVAMQMQQSTNIDNDASNTLNFVSQQVDEEINESNDILASIQQKVFSEETNEDEQLTMAYVQPGVFASINTFNIEPNIADKEAAGLLAKIEEKSDAEKRAEEVVAANKEQQDEINKNYMDQDQSGIVAAMGADTDVNAYRSRMLNDNNIWYRPEDIYKNAVYRDNVRGMYFLEKGSTDTYKQMVDEQYK